MNKAKIKGGMPAIAEMRASGEASNAANSGRFSNANENAQGVRASQENLVDIDDDVKVEKAKNTNDPNAVEEEGSEYDDEYEYYSDNDEDELGQSKGSKSSGGLGRRKLSGSGNL